jgi:hypothetical protein
MRRTLVRLATTTSALLAAAVLAAGPAGAAGPPEDVTQDRSVFDCGEGSLHPGNHYAVGISNGGHRRNLGGRCL